MNTRKPTFEELFPVAHQQDLLKKQSAHFTNQTISKMSISGGYENMPTNLMEVRGEPPVVINPNSPTKAFIKVDFPTFGFPMMFTKPALCDIYFNLISAKVNISEQ